MPVLQSSEYDAPYFDGAANPPGHPAGYDSYERWSVREGENSLGEYYCDLATRLAQSHSLQNKTVLELGCAKGFIVKDLRDLGIDAHGVDVSAYAIGKAEPGMSSFLTAADAATHLATLRDNQYDVIYSLRFLECIDDADLPRLISLIGSKGRASFHVVDDETRTVDPSFYNVKTLAEWSAFGWRSQTRFASQSTLSEAVK